MAAKSMEADMQTTEMSRTPPDTSTEARCGALQQTQRPALGEPQRRRSRADFIPAAQADREAEASASRRINRASAHRRVALLAHTLENDVIPRLVLARREASPPAYIDNVSGAAPSAEDVARLTALAQNGDLAGSLAYIGGLRSRGMPLERVYLGLLAPVARRLGEDDGGGAVVEHGGANIVGLRGGAAPEADFQTGQCAHGRWQGGH